jgi:hypothetical protein
MEAQQMKEIRTQSNRTGDGPCGHKQHHGGKGGDVAVAGDNIKWCCLNFTCDHESATVQSDRF